MFELIDVVLKIKIMNRKIKNRVVLLLIGLGTTALTQAQVIAQKIGTNPTVKQASAVLEVEHSGKGVLLPRVALTGLNDSATIITPANALTVFNTATAGTAPNEITPGYYYWNAIANKWIKLLNQGDVSGYWDKQGTTTTAVTNTENIYQMGSVAIGANVVPPLQVGSVIVQPKLYVDGDMSVQGKYYTANSMYADYVFEKYFQGSSDLNADYEFKSLDYVREFIQKNNHLPGVTPVGDLVKSTAGYTFDLTALTIQSLEKIEELYLHTIEQEDKIEKQYVEIEYLLNEMRKAKARLDKIESVRK